MQVVARYFMHNSNSDLLRQSNRADVRFLLAEIETGLNFLAIADTTPPNDGRERYLKTAREAYCIVQRLLTRVNFGPGEKLLFDSKLAELRIRLLAAGCSLETPPD